MRDLSRRNFIAVCCSPVVALAANTQQPASFSLMSDALIFNGAVNVEEFFRAAMSKRIAEILDSEW